MISYYRGDLLESGCDIICHQVNLDGVMGGGLAYQIAQKYPNCEKQYKEFCDNEEINLEAKVMFFSHKVNNCVKYIANCFTQRRSFVTDYNWLKRVVNTVRDFALSIELKTVGIPKNYGCGIAKGDWSVVEKLWVDAFKDSEDIELQIWEL